MDKLKVNTNPFIYGRREFESDSVIYITGGQEGYGEWISGPQYLFEGIRGSGKSSILRSMEWDVVWQLNNAPKIEGPAELINKAIKKPNFLGVRYRLEEMDISRWDTWKRFVGNDCASLYLGTYLEYILLDLFLKAIVSILNSNPELINEKQTEEAIVRELFTCAFPNPAIRPKIKGYSFWNLRCLISEQHMLLREHVYKKISESQINNISPTLKPGELVLCLGKSLIYHSKLKSIRLFPMLDDCNHLLDWQIRVVNTAISRAEYPVSYKVTSVSGLYKNKLTIDKREVNEHELKTFRISGKSLANWEYTQPYLKKVEGICKSRIESLYEKKYADKFDFKQMLGEFNLQELLLKTLRESEKLDILKLLEELKLTKNKNKSLTEVWFNEHSIRKQRGIIEGIKDQSKIARHFKSMHAKKWSYTVAFAICHQFGRPFPYAGWSTVTHLSCGSIRELLRIMSNIWDKVNLPIDKFVSKSDISYKIQREAIKKASIDFFNGLDKRPMDLNNDGSITTRESQEITSLAEMCDRLGNLFLKFQNFPYAYVTPETASLKVKKSEIEQELLDIVDFAVFTGALLKIEEGDYLKVGLHPILAPKYNISFRDPFYYPEHITGKQFNHLIMSNKTEHAHIVEKILNSRLARFENKQDAEQSMQENIRF